MGGMGSGQNGSGHQGNNNDKNTITTTNNNNKQGNREGTGNISSRVVLQRLHIVLPDEVRYPSLGEVDLPPHVRRQSPLYLHRSPPVAKGERLLVRRENRLNFISGPEAIRKKMIVCFCVRFPILNPTAPRTTHPSPMQHNNTTIPQGTGRLPVQRVYKV